MAGLILYYDTCNWIYAYVTWDEVQGCRVLRVMQCDGKDFAYGSEAVRLPEGEVSIRADVDHAEARFFYKTQRNDWAPLGGVQPADHLSDDYINHRRKRCAFSGAMVGICAQDMDAHTSYADFENFIYREEF